MLVPVLTSAPAATPVSLTEVKAHCRVDHTADDTVLTALLNAAVAHLDGWGGILGRCLVTQTWRQDYEDFSCPRLALGPVASIDAVTYYDATNAQQTLSTDVYTFRTDHLGSYLALKSGQSWPSLYDREDAVSISYVCGTAAESVPANLKAAILLLVSHWNEHREAVGAGTLAELPLGVRSLIGPSRKINV